MYSQGVTTVPLDDRVLDAVARILADGGVAALSLSSIAEEAGLSRVTLHRRGPSVDDYVVGVLRRASDDLRASLLPVLASTGDAAERLTTALGVLCDVAERHTGVLSALFRSPVRPIPGEPGRTTSFEFIEPFERLLLDGNLDGSLRSDDPRTDATLVANTVCWTYLHMRYAHRWSPGDTAERVIELAMAHLLPVSRP